MNVEVHDAVEPCSTSPRSTSSHEDDHHVATARGVYKTGGQDGESPWEAGVDRKDVDFDETGE